MRDLRWMVPSLLAALLLMLPWAVYVSRPARALDVVVVDKTVPFEDRREHRSLFWVLDHLKIRKPGGVAYASAVDYLGAFPGPEPGDPPERTSRLDAARVARADLIYVADTYGVYEGDLESGARMQAALERSPKIYGGLEEAEALAARRAVEQGKVLVVEFNSMASPTARRPREIMERVLGLRWTRWIGRYFPRLEDTGEVPRWMRDNYREIQDREWDFRGPGYVLLRDDERIEVLRVGEESRRIGLTIERTEPVDPLLASAMDRTPYPYWFDVVEPAAGTEVLASYRWRLTPAGFERLRAQGLPRSFPAVCRRAAPSGGRAYYFAGDFADNPMPIFDMPFAGFLELKRWSEGAKLAPSETAFYWRFYVPMMRQLLSTVEG